MQLGAHQVNIPAFEHHTSSMSKQNGRHVNVTYEMLTVSSKKTNTDGLHPLTFKLFFLLQFIKNLYKK